MKLKLLTVSFASGASRMLDGAKLSMNGLYAIEILFNFSSTTSLGLADLEGLPSNNTMGPINARTLQDVRVTHYDQGQDERPGRVLKKRAPIGQNVKVSNQVRATPADVRNCWHVVGRAGG